MFSLRAFLAVLVVLVLTDGVFSCDGPFARLRARRQAQTPAGVTGAAYGSCGAPQTAFQGFAYSQACEAAAFYPQSYSGAFYGSPVASESPWTCQGPNCPLPGRVQPSFSLNASPAAAPARLVVVFIP